MSVAFESAAGVEAAVLVAVLGDAVLVVGLEGGTVAGVPTGAGLGGGTAAIFGFGALGGGGNGTPLDATGEMGVFPAAVGVLPGGGRGTGGGGIGDAAAAVTGVEVGGGMEAEVEANDGGVDTVGEGEVPEGGGGGTPEVGIFAVIGSCTSSGRSKDTFFLGERILSSSLEDEDVFFKEVFNGLSTQWRPGELEGEVAVGVLKEADKAASTGFGDGVEVSTGLGGGAATSTAFGGAPTVLGGV